MFCLFRFGEFFRRKDNSQCSQTAYDKDQYRQRHDHSRLEAALVESDHDLAEHEDYRGIGDERDLEPVNGKVFYDAPKQFDNDEHGKYIRHHHVEGRRNGLAPEYRTQVQNDPRNSHHQGNDHDGDHEFDHGVDDPGEVFH